MKPPPRPIADPQPGFFRIRLAKRGWAVPCAIAHDPQTGRWTTIIDGTEKSALDPVDAGVFRIWLYGTPIEEWQYLDLVALKEWATAHAPDHPCLHAHKPINPMALALVPVPASFGALTR